jgi:hypothetical protein
MAGDKDTLQTFEFVLGDYDKNHWYWEVNEMQSHSIEVAERLVNATGDILARILPMRSSLCTLQVVELGRKLILSGLIGLVGRKTIAQSVVGLVLHQLYTAAPLLRTSMPRC